MTSSRELVVLDSCSDLFEAEAGVFGCGRTPSTRMDLAITSTRCFLRRRSWRLRGEGLGIPSPHLGCHGGNVDIISRPLYLAVNCSVSLASDHTYADFWEMIPGIVSAFYLFGSGYTYGVSLRGYGQKFTISTCRWFLGDDFRIVSVFSAQLGSIMDTCTASVYEASEISHSFVFWWSLVSPYSALSLVRERIHAVRQSTRLSGISLIFCVLWSLGDDFMFVSVFSAEFGSTVDT